jgi:hypothetical protein
MSELLAHLRERENAVPHFYCDDKGLVTLAIGFLVDQDHTSSTAPGLKIATELARRADVRFVARDGSPATVTDVQQDWLTIKNLWLATRPKKLAEYSSAARLRIDAASIDRITQPLVLKFLGTLYARKPFVKSYHPKLSMALVDVRYNAAGVALYKLDALFNLLDPTHRDYDPAQAVVIFENTWATRGVYRYAQRHWRRTQWFRDAVTNESRDTIVLHSV